MASSSAFLEALPSNPAGQVTLDSLLFQHQALLSCAHCILTATLLCTPSPSEKPSLLGCLVRDVKN